MVIIIAYLLLILALIYDSYTVVLAYKKSIKGYGSSNPPLVTMVLYFFFWILTSNSLSGNKEYDWYYFISYHILCHFLFPPIVYKIYNIDKYNKNRSKEEWERIHEERWMNSLIEKAKDKWHGRKYRISYAQAIAEKWIEKNLFNQDIFDDLPKESQDVIIKEIKKWKPGLLTNRYYENK
jgi:hypothetical protein